MSFRAFVAVFIAGIALFNLKSLIPSESGDITPFAIETDTINPSTPSINQPDIEINAISTMAKTTLKRISPTTTYESYLSELGPLPSSLRGTTVPAYFEIDMHGHLIITKSIMNTIEYFLSTLGEETLEIAIGRAEEYFTKHLQEPAQSEAINVLAQYINYKEALIDLEQLSAEHNSTSADGHDYLEMFRLRNEIRLSHLSPEVYEAFFSVEEKLDLYAARLLELKMESRFNDIHIKEETKHLERLLPASEQKAKSEIRVREAILNAKTQGASQEELYTLRADAYGNKVAERFARAEEKTQQWNERYKMYSIKREEILKSSGLSDEDKTHEITILQQTMFDHLERKRLPTLDKMNAARTSL